MGIKSSRPAAGATVTAAGAAAVGVEDGVTSAGLLQAATGAAAAIAAAAVRVAAMAAAIAAAAVPPLTALRPPPLPSLPFGGTASAGAAEVVHCWAAEGVS